MYPERQILVVAGWQQCKREFHWQWLLLFCMVPLKKSVHFNFSNALMFFIRTLAINFVSQNILFSDFFFFFGPTSWRDQNKRSKSRIGIKMLRWLFKIEFRNEFFWYPQWFAMLGACLNYLRINIKVAGPVRQQTSYDTWRRFVHPIPIIITNETRF